MGNTDKVNVQCPAPDIPTNTSSFKQYATAVTANDGKFYIPSFTSACNITSMSLIGTNASDMTLTQSGDDWIVLPNY